MTCTQTLTLSVVNEPMPYQEFLATGGMDDMQRQAGFCSCSAC